MTVLNLKGRECPADKMCAEWGGENHFARRKGRAQKLPAVKDIQEGTYASGGKEDTQNVMKIYIPSKPVTLIPFLRVRYLMCS